MTNRTKGTVRTDQTNLGEIQKLGHAIGLQIEKSRVTLGECECPPLYGWVRQPDHRAPLNIYCPPGYVATAVSLGLISRSLSA